MQLRIGSPERIIVPIWIILGFPQRDRQDSQNLNFETFCRLPVVSAQCTRNFVRNAIKGDRRNAFIQHYKSELSHELFKIFLNEFNVNCNICDLPEKYFNFLSK